MKMLRIIYNVLLLVLSSSIFMIIAGCGTNWLDEQPLSSISESTFWISENDAKLALTGVYAQSTVGDNSYNNHLLCLSSATDDAEYKWAGVGIIYSGYFLPSSGEVVPTIWNRSYATIFRANYFLENIESVEMDADLKAQYIAEVRFLRAFEYYYLSVMYGGVPLITKVLTIEEANTQSRNSLDEIVNFAIDELTESAIDLPSERPDNERGRIVKSAALAIKGRLLMIHKRWDEAVGTFKEIIDLNVHEIDSQYKALFEEKGENSKEIILSTNCIAGLRGNPQNQLNYHADLYGGYHETCPTQDLVDAFLMTDGLSIDESSLYDPKYPYKNRDPRLYASIFLPEYTVFRGKLFLAHPESTTSGLATLTGATGYSWKKYVTEDYEGANNNSGDDIILLRYAEVLLSYLESKIENGDNISQELLDQTINQIRKREEINMPIVTETNRDKLREIVRRERRVEFCFERHIRYFDIRRWGLFPDIVNRKVYGMKLTDDPDNYTKYRVEKVGRYRGHYIAVDKTGSFTSDMALLPIPIYEMNINKNLVQNPGY
ncbi:MAG: hypothetical protein PETM_01597 [Petrimonas sp.]|uniref:RagB/SusD family nutrient uptake outer membrane protein n=1 Tax=Petrimonas sp. TaxID=2023866 RepID=UPI0030CF406C